MDNDVCIIAVDEAIYFTLDKTFERRFNIIPLKELSREQTIIIIKNTFPQTKGWSVEQFERVFNYLDNHFEGRHYPDKAFDFFDFYYSGQELLLFKSYMDSTILSKNKLHLFKRLRLQSYIRHLERQ